MLIYVFLFKKNQEQYISFNIVHRRGVCLGENTACGLSQQYQVRLGKYMYPG